MALSPGAIDAGRGGRGIMRVWRVWRLAGRGAISLEASNDHGTLGVYSAG